MDDRIAHRLKLNVFGQWHARRKRFRIGAYYFLAPFVPQVVQLGNTFVLSDIIYNGAHERLHVLFQISVHLLTFRFGKFARKPHEFLFEYGIVESLFVDARCDLGDAFPAFLFQVVPVLRLLFIYADKVLRKNIPREDRQQLIAEKNELQAKLGEITEERGRQQTVQDRLETIYTVLDGLKNRPMTYDDEVVRQLIDCVVVESKDRIKVIFCGGLQVEQQLRQEDMDFLSEMGQAIPI